MVWMKFQTACSVFSLGRLKGIRPLFYLQIAHQCGSRLSLMTKRRKCCFSNTQTLKPCLFSKAEATEPEEP